MVQWWLRLGAALFIILNAQISMAFAQNEFHIFNAFDENSERVIDHDAWDVFLGAFVKKTKDNRTIVDYKSVSADHHTALKAYIKSLEEQDPTGLKRNEAFAYWANLYNALTVDVILDHYPLKSIMRIRSGIRPGPWRRKLTRINGVELTLDNIEHDILRKYWSDNRVHYAVNCASVSCPNLLQKAFRGSGLNRALNNAARAYVNHPRGVAITDGRVVVSTIYKWYQVDFGGNEAGVLAHLKEYAKPELAAALCGVTRIDRYDYDWDLNDITP